MYTVLEVDDTEVFRRKIKRLPYWHTNGKQFQIDVRKVSLEQLVLS